ncbi:AMP-binding protein [Blastococcus brunescens]|uniref:AMP-binding protein n=1 Tax=Blastococcus brunescens TaxID=1564165 RepID=A0ABZ1B0C3_9ACTN|nr:AMP-binding protein [Blastococcus sp. BMG 8361]WRL63173.1 AMP-binding protein [Blastococcus sp. BMG 8361]
MAIQLPNGLAWLRAALGALRAGLVVVPVNTAYTDPELEFVLTDSAAGLLVAATDRSPVAGVPVCPGPPDAEGPRRRSLRTRRRRPSWPTPAGRRAVPAAPSSPPRRCGPTRSSAWP